MGRDKGKKSFGVRAINCIFLFLGLCESCSTLNNHRFFDNKIIVYKSDSGSDNNSSEFNSYFIAYRHDLLVQVNYPYNFMEKSVKDFEYKLMGSDTIFKEVYSYHPLSSNTPYSFNRKGNRVFLNYKKNNKHKSGLFYSLDQKDSVSIVDRRHICDESPFNKGLSNYSGQDTVINFYGQKLKCWVFVEYYSRRPGLINRKILVYLEKKNNAAYYGDWSVF